MTMNEIAALALSPRRRRARLPAKCERRGRLSQGVAHLQITAPRRQNKKGAGIAAAPFLLPILVTQTPEESKLATENYRSDCLTNRTSRLPYALIANLKSNFKGAASVCRNRAPSSGALRKERSMIRRFLKDEN